MNPDNWTIERLGVVMAPDESNPNEAWGVLNPATARDRDGELLLFPRVVAEGNYSRVGKARVNFDGDGVPVGVERLGVAFEPQEAWELNERTGGTEDARITYVERLDRYVMTYTAFGPVAPRIGIAVSADLDKWERLGPVLYDYDPALETDLNLYSNKDGALFPEPVTAPDGRDAFALVHRPTWDLSWFAKEGGEPLPTGVSDPRGSIWISFVPVEEVERDLRKLTHVGQHREVATPQFEWEEAKIGAGPPPVRIDGGWLLIHHGVTGEIESGTDHQSHVRYCAGAIVLDPDDVTMVIARSTTPLLEPALAEEQQGIVDNVVFPTGLDVRDDDTIDVYYGMADARIGVGRLRLGG